MPETKQKQAEHTPGPWRSIADSTNDSQRPWMGSTEGAKGVMLANVLGAGAANEANARLIAAAPELLEALQLAEKYLSKAAADGLMEDCAIPLSNALRPIRAAISKAVGK